MTIDGIVVRADAEAVVIVSAQPLRLLSSAVHRGGSVSARAVVNLHVGKDDSCADPSAMLTDYARRAGVPEPFVGLLTGAWTELAALGEETARAFLHSPWPPWA
jgi:adenosylcobinamide amidohydrolase